ncbi:uncharacterized protein BO97DRAFT_408476 [Aspergillus homomorphus CBS 101889]|uniref:Uncharacterized protein n=1 Tax=Aspergillus homomorphus (strain CBS 101889) TaxID=1450537 RepID=A0A395HN63_ASPHC|nr:hypothetical protein BO97DRAFT_408476 [Aspergillus homomorphus CBS 101889]RAL08278.1 hypothetical protein BO97DRAFT_408476 [Aspergillus homomorphus CBS 101889]
MCAFTSPSPRHLNTSTPQHHNITTSSSPIIVIMRSLRTDRSRDCSPSVKILLYV